MKGFWKSQAKKHRTHTLKEFRVHLNLKTILKILYSIIKQTWIWRKTHIQLSYVVNLSPISNPDDLHYTWFVIPLFYSITSKNYFLFIHSWLQFFSPSFPFWDWKSSETSNCCNLRENYFLKSVKLYFRFQSISSTHKTQILILFWSFALKKYWNQHEERIRKS